MAEPRICSIRTFSKPTFIYVLMDLDTLEVRYLGKTVKTLKERLATHVSFARKDGHKRHALAWIRSLLDAGKLPIIQLVETIAPNADWIVAEQRWIAELREAGADLCNLTDGGEGGTGYKPTPEAIEKARRPGVLSWNYGKPMSFFVKDALAKALKEKRKDSEWSAWWNEQRKAGYTPEIRARCNAALLDHVADPVKLAAREVNRKAAMKQPKTRALIGADSKKRWAEDRQKIIDAQNAGKGEAYKQKQREIRTALWADPEWRARILETRRVAFLNRKLKNSTT